MLAADSVVHVALVDGGSSSVCVFQYVMCEQWACHFLSLVSVCVCIHVCVCLCVMKQLCKIA